jgi:hypothetical protein
LYATDYDFFDIPGTIFFFFLQYKEEIDVMVEAVKRAAIWQVVQQWKRN